MTTHADQILSIPITAIVPNPHQPRRDFDERELLQLAASLKRDSLMQPIGVRPLANDTFELIFGERRLRAAKLVPWMDIPARVLNVTENQAITMLASENLYRSDWNPIEKAGYFESLARPIDEGGAGLSSKCIGKLFGHSTEWVNRLRYLLKLPDAIREAVRIGDMGAGVAVEAFRPYADNPHVRQAIVDDFASNREFWSSQKTSVRRAKMVAAKCDASECNQSDIATEKPLSLPSRFNRYLPLFKPFRGNLAVLSKLHDLLQSLVDEAESHHA